MKATIEAIERELMSDGLRPGEGVFLACSFWMVSSLKAIGRIENARALFERLLTLCNDLGLLSEEYDTKSKRLVGNFPQAFSHIALVNAAFDLADSAGTRDRAAGTGVERAVCAGR